MYRGRMKLSITLLILLSAAVLEAGGDALIRLGLHTATHPACSRLNAASVRDEILDPARRL